MQEHDNGQYLNQSRRDHQIDNIVNSQYSPKKLHQLHSIMRDDLQTTRSLPQKNFYDNLLIFLTMLFLVISIAFSIIIFQRHERTQLNGANNVIEHVKWNLDKNAIQSLKQIKINQACPPGYNKQVLQKWLGTQN